VAWGWHRDDLFLRTAKDRYDFRAAQKFLGEDRNRLIYEYYQGLFEVRRNAPAAARERLAAMERLLPQAATPPDADPLTAGTEQLRTEILLAEGRPQEALAAFEKIQRTPLSVFPLVLLVQRNVPYILDLKGRAQVMMGNKEQAIALYERFVSPDPRLREMELLHPFSRLELAKLYVSTGDRTKAITQLEQLAEFWKEADAGLPQVEEARRLLTTLRAK
jgi:tetratricopeptide (TPR) repeat protein